MHRLHAELHRQSARITRWLNRWSVTLLRISLGLVFLGFGALKFVPGLSPAEDLAGQAVGELTFGLLPESLGLIFVATLETAIGLCLVTGRLLRFGLALLGLAMVGILSPLVLLPEELFAGALYAPTLAGQYVLKDVVLLAAGLVVAADVLGKPAADRREAAPPRVRHIDESPWRREREPGRAAA